MASVIGRSKRDYVIMPGSFHEKFWVSRSKIQFIGGAFANGKTTAGVVKGLHIAKNYPGSIGLMARATKPKLRTTLMREVFKWCPKSWIKSFNKGDGELVLINESRIDFRYISQKGTDEGDSTSNLLSATYDWAFIDQIEDPEIQEKDFDDIMGRLRGDAPYTGDDPTMPKDGPRWFIVTANPTGGWPYYKLAKPLIDWRNGIENKDLIVDPETHEPMIEMFEGSTYDNSHNLKADFIRGLEATYRGQMRDRFLLGKWASYEGLVYPDYNDKIHLVEHSDCIKYLQGLRESRYTLSFLEGYDHGIHSPSCYLLAFVDDFGNVTVFDGFYEPEYSIHKSAQRIKTLRMVHGVNEDNTIWADPQIFRRSGTSDSKVVGRATNEIFEIDEDVRSFVRGNNNIINGIAKISSYLTIDPKNRNPYTGTQGAPKMYFSNKLEFMRREISSYHWKRQKSTGEIIDSPSDKNDHAMDALKYLMSGRPKPSEYITSYPQGIFPLAHIWHIKDNTPKEEQIGRNHRHG